MKMVIHTVLNCKECRFFTDADLPWCSYHTEDLTWYYTDATIPNWCELRTNAILVMTDPNKLQKAEEK